MSKPHDVARLCVALAIINDAWLDRVAYWILRGLDKRGAESMADFEIAAGKQQQEHTDDNRS